MFEACRQRKAQMLICAVLFVEGIALIFYESLTIAWEDYDVALRLSSFLSDEDMSKYIGKKKVLLWTHFFEDDWFHMGKTGHFDHCPTYKDCVMTRSRDLVNIRNFHAILFHANEMNASDLPASRSPRQQYVFVNLESPKNRPLTDSYLENYFNMTMSYRMDSDIPWPYYVVRNMDTGEMVAPALHTAKWAYPSYEPLIWNYDLRFDGKKKTAAWLVSNCNTYGKRELLVEELEEFIEVDRIGKCAEEVIPDCTNSTDDCFANVIEPKYFFYFSFENTLCQDYVTEKFFNALSYDVIPVVYGGANYKLFAPPHSYIDALDFDSPKDLANFLIELSHDREEYLKYFWWKRFYAVDTPTEWTLCKICEQISVRKPRKVYSPLSRWYVRDQCPIQDILNSTNHATREIKSRIMNRGPVQVPVRKKVRKVYADGKTSSINKLSNNYKSIVSREKSFRQKL